MLNRSAVIVRPREPYAKWASSLPGIPYDPETDEDEVVYLLPTYDTHDEAVDIIEEAWPVLFESQLDAWHEDESAWPQNRTFAMFTEWFEVEFHSIVIDLTEGDLVNEWDDDYEVDAP